MQLNVTKSLLNRVGRRQGLARLGGRAHLALLILAGMYVILLLVSRLLGLFPDWFGPLSILVPPAAALLLASVFLSWPGRLDAARCVDAYLDTKDLFLTTVLVDSATGAFKPLVLEEAEFCATGVRPGDVVPLRLWPGARNSLLVMGILLAGSLFFPAFDLFGKGEEDLVNQVRLKLLEDSRKATALRVENLKREGDRKQSEDVKTRIAELKKAFKELEPGKKNENLARLQGLRKQLNRSWREIQEKQQNRFFLKSGAQQFGGRTSGKRSEWKKSLEKGDDSGIRKELAEVKKMAEMISAMADSQEKENLKKKLAERLEALEELSELDLNSEALRAALERALDQLEMSDLHGLESQAIDGLRETLDLSQSELERVLRSLKDLQALEAGLEAARLAEGCCASGRLSKGMPGGLSSLEDYEKFYQSLMNNGGGSGSGQGKGSGSGEGMGGAGTGAGNRAPEAKDLETDFKSERSRSALTAGRHLLRWKTRGNAPPGKVKENYKDLIRKVKQGMSEAVLQERVPPGYHKAIQKYFDAIENRTSGPPGK